MRDEKNDDRGADGSADARRGGTSLGSGRRGDHGCRGAGDRGRLYGERGAEALPVAERAGSLPCAARERTRSRVGELSRDYGRG